MCKARYLRTIRLWPRVNHNGVNYVPIPNEKKNEKNKQNHIFNISVTFLTTKRLMIYIIEVHCGVRPRREERDNDGVTGFRDIIILCKEQEAANYTGRPTNTRQMEYNFKYKFVRCVWDTLYIVYRCLLYRI